MRPSLLASLTSKAVAGIAIATLAAGAAGTAIVTQTISDDTPASSEHADHHADEHATNNTGHDADENEATGNDDHDTKASDAGTHEHPDNFGAKVSAAAHAGGVDGQTVSQWAHDKNAARCANVAPADQHGKSCDDHDQAGTSSTHSQASDEHGKADDEHGQSGEHEDHDD